MGLSSLEGSEVTAPMGLSSPEESGVLQLDPQLPALGCRWPTRLFGGCC